jgi:transcription initiation factor TFIID TATA-box-binding protein
MQDSVIRITNVVTTADLRQTIDIIRFNDFSWGRYDYEDNYNGKVGYIKNRQFEGRVTVFTSGKLISTGARSVGKSIDQLHRSQQLLVKHKFAKQVLLEPRIRNIVATLDAHKRIDINAFSIAVPNSLYDPEQFPAVISRASPDATCLVFSSGKIVIAGAKSEERLLKTANIILKKIKDFHIE